MSIAITQSLMKNIDLVTDENQTEDDWSKILDVCEVGSKDVNFCFQHINKRLNSRNPHIVLRSLILLDACMQNIGEQFANELSSKKFFNDIKQRSPHWQPKIIETLCFMSKKWNREFNDKAKYAILNELDNWLADKFTNIYTMIDQNEISKKSHRSSRKQAASLKEDQDLAAAIAASLKEAEPAKSKPQSSLYPTGNEVASSGTVASNVTTSHSVSSTKIPRVRALYDFQAEDENELSFSAGEIIVDVDTGNEHWWHGHNQRGEGLFPAQFVTKDVGEKGNDTSQKGVESQSPKMTNNTTISTFQQQIVIDESKIDNCLKLIDDADPTGEIKPDSAELTNLETNCRQMGPLIDQELEKVDRQYNSLVELNKQVMMAFQTYNELMLGSALGVSGRQQHLQQAHPVWMIPPPNPQSVGGTYPFNYPSTNVTTNVQMHPPTSQAQFQDYMRSSGNFNMFYPGNLHQNASSMGVGNFNEGINPATAYQSMQQPQATPGDAIRPYMSYPVNVSTVPVSMPTTNSTLAGNTQLSQQLPQQQQQQPQPQQQQQQNVALNNGTNNNNIDNLSRIMPDYQPQFNYDNADNNINQAMIYGDGSLGISTASANTIYPASHQTPLMTNQNNGASHQPTTSILQQQSAMNQPGFSTDNLNPQQPIQTNPY